MDPESVRRWAVASSAVCAALALAGCAHLGAPGPDVLPAAVPPESSAPFLSGDWQIAVQYAHAPGRPAAYGTLEVYLTNRGNTGRRFATVLLDGMELMPLDRLPRVKPLDISVDGEQISLNPVPAPARDVATWWQFYPSPEVAPGETVVFQVNFRKTPTSRHRLELADSEGGLLDLTIPRRREAPVRLSAVTFLRDFSRMYVQWQGASEPERLWVNEREAAGLRVLRPPETGQPCTAAFAPPVPVQAGTALYVRARFPGGLWRHALVRTLPGISLTAPFDQSRPSAEDEQALRLDLVPAVALLGPDVACGDVKMKDEGGSAAAVVAERVERLAKAPAQLSAVGYCTAMYPGIWALYGQVADAVCSKPYRLGFGHDPSRFIEEEADCVAKARDTAAPRPFLWVPDRMKRRRFLEPPEIEALGWTMLAKGAKGIRYHFWRNPGTDPFAGDKTVLPALQALDAGIRAREDVLAPLAPLGERTVGDDRRGWVKVYTACAGELGLLIVVRNLDYRTDERDNAGGTQPRFKATEKRDVALDLALPEWLAFGWVEDAITGAKVEAAPSGNSVSVRLDRLDAVRVLWIGSGRKGP